MTANKNLCSYKKMVIQTILATIEKYPKIQLDTLIHKLNVNEPYISKKKSADLIESMTKDLPPKIKINEDNQVLVCQS